MSPRANDYRLRAYAAAAKETNDSQNKAVAELDAKISAIKSGGLFKIPRQRREGEEKSGGESKDESVYRRVAKFLLLIGVDEAADVLRFLPQDDVEKIIPEIATISSVAPDEAAAILDEFHGLVEKLKEGGGEATAFNILQKAFGQGVAKTLMNRVEARMEFAHPFSCLKEKSAEEILSILKGESPSVMAIVLSHLKPKKAAAVINIMSDEQKKDVVLRLAKRQKVSADAISTLDKAISQKAATQVRDDSLRVDGRGALLQILRKMDLKAEREVLDGIERTDPDLRADLQAGLFTTEDVINCDDLFLQRKLRDMSDREIAYLIADKDESFLKKIFSNVSTGRGDMILEEESALKPMLKKDVDAVTKAFLESLRIAWQKGSLIIKGRDDEEFV